MYVNMPVKCLNKDCIRCPNLQIGIDKTVLFADNEKLLNGENDLFCSNWQACVHAYQLGNNDCLKGLQEIRTKNIALNEER